jgi:RNA 3'-terminal phosphate cyclase (ATP)
LIKDPELIGFLQWCLPKLQLRWSGFRKVRGTLRKRLTRRLQQHGLNSLTEYRQLLGSDPAEWATLDAACRIPISRFYRDRAVYELLASDILPDCATQAGNRSDDIINVLSAGCASGEEPYSVSLIWHTRVAQSFSGCKIQIVAVDVDESMLKRAHVACYSSTALRELPRDLVDHAFQLRRGVHCLKHRYGNSVQFKKCDLRQSVPAGPFDLILCRNTAFTYFDEASQICLASKLKRALRPGGYLVIGAHETIPDSDDNKFTQPWLGRPIFRKAEPQPARIVSAKTRHTGRLVIDGSHGEGGGQILRSALSLSAITGRPVRIENIRARRRRPGLAAQHLTAVRAVAEICQSTVNGDQLHSETVEFTPISPVLPGHYDFDVSSARKGGSAGSAPLVLQAVLVPLAFADGPSSVQITGGTHIPWSPSYDYLRDVWLPTLSEIGIRAQVELCRWGWFPAGGGILRCSVSASMHNLNPLRIVERGPLEHVSGRAVVARLPEHISHRMANQAITLLDEAGISSSIRAEVVDSISPGAGIFLAARYANVLGGYSSVGKRGRPAEDVATEAVNQLLEHQNTAAALEHHLADQLILPLCLATGPSYFSVERVSGHLKTHAWLVEQFGLACVTIAQNQNGSGKIRIEPKGSRQ